MTDFEELVAIFDGSNMVPTSADGDAGRSFTRRECQRQFTYSTFFDDEEPFDLSLLIARWWPVEATTRPEAARINEIR